MKAIQLIVFAGLFLCLPCTLVAQKYQLTGRALNAQKEALEGATVILYLNDSIANAAITDKKGNFKVENVAKGDYLLQIASLGYKPYEKQLAFANDVALGEVLLEEDAQLMDQVTISADNRDRISNKGGVSTFHLSNSARNSAHNAFEALREIPKLVIDETNRSIKLNDGSAPLILVNGVVRPGYINSLDPKDIESVEVIENASARYRGSNGATTVLNLKIKRKTKLSTTVNVYTRHNPELVFGVSGGSFNLGNSKASLYLNVQHFYFDNDKKTSESMMQTGTMTREWKGTGTYDANSLALTLGGDWIASSKDYLAFAIEYVTNPSETNNQATGFASDASNSRSALQMEQFLKNKYFTNVYSLFYKRTFNKNRHLEATAKFGWFGSGNTGWRKENSELYAYNTLIDMDNDKKSLSLDLNYDFTIPDKFAFNIGSNTYWQRNKLEDEVDAFLPFIFKGLNEYVYADMSSLSDDKFSYMLSVGVDMVFNNAAGVKHDYINVVPSLSLTYNFDDKNTLQLTASRDRTSPSVSYLNPRNTSTDSLQVIAGNPYLEPVINNKFRLSYQWMPKGLYLEPFAEYSIYQGLVEAVSTVNGAVRTTTYANVDDISVFKVGLTGRVNFGSWGNLSATAYYSKRIDDKMHYSGNHWGGDMNLYLRYKKVSLNTFVYYDLMTYERTSKSRITPTSETTFNWRLPKGWTLIASVRDIGKSIGKTWGKDVDYSYYERTHYKDRGTMFLVGFSYYFKNKVKNPYRQKKQLHNSDEGVGIKVQ